jgi:hypothetical protein
MDKYDVSEVSYKNGYAKGFDDAMTHLSLIRRDPSSRKAKWDFLKQELEHWGYSDWYSDTIDVMMAIANELSWRIVVRIVHKLRRKRGAER